MKFVAWMSLWSFRSIFAHILTENAAERKPREALSGRVIGGVGRSGAHVRR